MPISRQQRLELGAVAADTLLLQSAADHRVAHVVTAGPARRIALDIDRSLTRDADARVGHGRRHGGSLVRPCEHGVDGAVHGRTVGDEVARHTLELRITVQLEGLVAGVGGVLAGQRAAVVEVDHGLGAVAADPVTQLHGAREDEGAMQVAAGDAAVVAVAGLAVQGVESVVVAVGVRREEPVKVPVVVVHRPIAVVVDAVAELDASRRDRAGRGGRRVVLVVVGRRAAAGIVRGRRAEVDLAVAVVVDPIRALLRRGRGDVGVVRLGVVGDHGDRAVLVDGHVDVDVDVAAVGLDDAGGTDHAGVRVAGEARNLANPARCRGDLGGRRAVVGGGLITDAGERAAALELRARERAHLAGTAAGLDRLVALAGAVEGREVGGVGVDRQVGVDGRVGEALASRARGDQVAATEQGARGQGQENVTDGHLDSRVLRVIESVSPGSQPRDTHCRTNLALRAPISGTEHCCDLTRGNRQQPIPHIERYIATDYRLKR